MRTEDETIGRFAYLRPRLLITTHPSTPDGEPGPEAQEYAYIMDRLSSDRPILQ